MLLHSNALASDPLANLQLAAAIELATIPPYLYAAWSVRPREDGGSFAAAEAARLIRSVVYEEMLHLALVANVINALGGVLDLTSQVPTYPGMLPGHATSGPFAFSVSLEPLSERAINTFMRIEMPEWMALQGGRATSDDWITLAAFYKSIETQLRALPDSEFSHGRQLPVGNKMGAYLRRPHDKRKHLSWK